MVKKEQEKSLNVLKRATLYWLNYKNWDCENRMKTSNRDAIIEECAQTIEKCSLVDASASMRTTDSVRAVELMLGSEHFKEAARYIRNMKSEKRKGEK